MAHGPGPGGDIGDDPGWLSLDAIGGKMSDNDDGKKVDDVERQLAMVTAENERLWRNIKEKRFIDALPDEMMVVRILSAYIDTSEVTDNLLGMESTNPLIVAMMASQRKRNDLLRRAIARLTDGQAGVGLDSVMDAPGLSWGMISGVQCDGTSVMDRREDVRVVETRYRCVYANNAFCLFDKGMADDHFNKVRACAAASNEDYGIECCDDCDGAIPCLANGTGLVDIVDTYDFDGGVKAYTYEDVPTDPAELEKWLKAREVMKNL